MNVSPFVVVGVGVDVIEALRPWLVKAGHPSVKFIPLRAAREAGAQRACVRLNFFKHLEVDMRQWHLKWLAAALAGLAVAACGGGDDATHGAIALNASDPAAIIVTNFVSQAKANEAAVTRCGAGCEVIYEFTGSGRCGALATGGGSALVWGVAGGRSAAEAEAGAVAQCVAKGGANCAVPASIPGKCLP